MVDASDGVDFLHRRKNEYPESMQTNAAGHAGRLHDRLKSWFDAEDVFYDQESIGSGDDFRGRIRVAVSGAKVVLVLIAPDWVTEINRRAARPGVDFVRAEVELALRLNATHGVPKIIPVVLGDHAGARALQETL